MGQQFVATDRVCGFHPLFGQAGTDYIDTIKGGFLVDLLLVYCILKFVVADIEYEVFPDLEPVDYFADSQADLVFTVEFSLADALTNTFQLSINLLNVLRVILICRTPTIYISRRMCLFYA